MKKLINFVGLITLLTASHAYAENWVTGAYINQDDGALMDEVIFCPNGVADVSGIARTYTMKADDDNEYVVLSSNGVFTFSLNTERTEMHPADDFTKSWFTKTHLKLDPTKQNICN